MGRGARRAGLRGAPGRRRADRPDRRRRPRDPRARVSTGERTGSRSAGRGDRRQRPRRRREHLLAPDEPDGVARGRAPRCARHRGSGRAPSPRPTVAAHDVPRARVRVSRRASPARCTSRSTTGRDASSRRAVSPARSRSTTGSTSTPRPTEPPRRRRARASSASRPTTSCCCNRRARSRARTCPAACGSRRELQRALPDRNRCATGSRARPRTATRPTLDRVLERSDRADDARPRRARGATRTRRATSSSSRRRGRDSATRRSSRSRRADRSPSTRYPVLGEITGVRPALLRPRRRRPCSPVSSARPTSAWLDDEPAAGPDELLASPSCRRRSRPAFDAHGWHRLVSDDPVLGRRARVARLVVDRPAGRLRLPARSRSSSSAIGAATGFPRWAVTTCDHRADRRVRDPARPDRRSATASAPPSGTSTGRHGACHLARTDSSVIEPQSYDRRMRYRRFGQSDLDRLGGRHRNVDVRKRLVGHVDDVDAVLQRRARRGHHVHRHRAGLRRRRRRRDAARAAAREAPRRDRADHQVRLRPRRRAPRRRAERAAAGLEADRRPRRSSRTRCAGSAPTTSISTNCTTRASSPSSTTTSGPSSSSSAPRAKVRELGVALGPAIGWVEEGVRAVDDRPIVSLQTVFNIIEQEPGLTFARRARVSPTGECGLISRVPHASDTLSGRVTPDTVFEPPDHRAHRNRDNMLDNFEKAETLSFLWEPETGRTIGQAAVAGHPREPGVHDRAPDGRERGGDRRVRGGVGSSAHRRRAPRTSTSCSRATSTMPTAT